MSDKFNDEQFELIYEQGNRAALLGVLQHCCSQLGYGDSEAKKASWILERETAVSALRSVCAEYGDNHWEKDLYLADIIEKHLHRNLNSNKNG